MTRFAAVLELELAYTDAGAGPVVLLLHGYPFDRSMWNGQIEILRHQGFRAIAPDLNKKFSRDHDHGRDGPLCQRVVG